MMAQHKQHYIEVFKSFASDKSFSMSDIEAKKRELFGDESGPDRGLEFGNALVTETSLRPMDGRQLFAGHKVGWFRWLDLSEEEIAEMRRLDRMPH